MAQPSYEVFPQPQGSGDPGHPYGDGDREPPLVPDDPPLSPVQVTPPPRGDDDDEQ
jgi:hypothetical protein